MYVYPYIYMYRYIYINIYIYTYMYISIVCFGRILLPWGDCVGDGHFFSHMPQVPHVDAREPVHGTPRRPALWQEHKILTIHVQCMPHPSVHIPGVPAPSGIYCTCDQRVSFTHLPMPPAPLRTEPHRLSIGEDCSPCAPLWRRPHPRWISL